jgi:hypothetical protein
MLMLKPSLVVSRILMLKPSLAPFGAFRQRVVLCRVIASCAAPCPARLI